MFPTRLYLLQSTGESGGCFVRCSYAHASFLPDGVELRFGDEEEMGTGSMCTPPAAQSIAKQVDDKRSMNDGN